MNRHNLFWGVFLILIGALFFANTLGIFNVNIWGLIWPAFLIALGVWVLWATRAGQQDVEKEALSVPLIEGIQSAAVKVGYGGGRLKLNGGTGPGELMAGGFAGGVTVDLNQEGDVQLLRLRAPSDFSPIVLIPTAWSAREWDFRLSADLPLHLDVSTGGSDARLDLRTLQVSRLKLDAGASTTEVLLPEQAGETSVKVSGGAMTVNIHVPQHVAARIKISGALMTRSIDRTRFPRSGSYYQSAGYEDAENRADIRIDMGVGTVRIV